MRFTPQQGHGTIIATTGVATGIDDMGTLTLVNLLVDGFTNYWVRHYHPPRHEATTAPPAMSAVAVASAHVGSARPSATSSAVESSGME